MAESAKRPEQIYKMEAEAVHRHREITSRFARLLERSAAYLAAKSQRKQPVIIVERGDMEAAVHRLIVAEEDRGIPPFDELEMTYRPAGQEHLSRNVFISHDTRNERWVRDLKSRLRRKRIGSFVASASIRPGEEFLKRILRVLREANVVLFAATKSSIEESEWCKMEVGAALGLDKPVVSALIGVTVKDLPPFLQHLQAIAIQTPADLTKLVDELERICNELQL